MSDKTNEEFNNLKQQLQTARRLLEKNGGILPDKKFFDPSINAFDAKIIDILIDALHNNGVHTESVIENICEEFMEGFDTHIKAMTPFSKVPTSKGKK